MAFNELDAQDKELIRQCMVTIARGPFIDDAEFQTRLGITRSDLELVLTQWPELDDSVEESDTTLAINNCLNEVVHGGAIPIHEWPQWFSESREHIKQVYARWLGLNG